MTDKSLQDMVDDAEAMCLLIGRRVRYLDVEYEVTDLLPAEGLMILSADDGDDVQEDIYGRPHRLVPKRQNLRFRDAEGHPTGIWQDMAFLDGPLIG
ncbi:MAG TPA: hypothetical protein VKA31_03155 [Mariprofundaceae bacterium]|nr:hypothetical protein [Mariprofundaceae bacterium]